MPLADIVELVRAGVVQISFLNANAQRIGSGTGFIARGRLLTNHHVFRGHESANSVHMRREQLNDPVVLAPTDFGSALRSGSMEDSYDYAILEIPQLITGTEHQFDIEPPGNRRMGDQIAILGYPFEHQNLTIHAGVISSFYRSNLTDVIQLDASVNAGNSGGPLIDAKNGVVFGMVTRKATGLTRGFANLRQTLRQNIQAIRAAGGGGFVAALGGINLFQALEASQAQMLTTLDEIERQANVGIGYAMSAQHFLSDIAIHGAQPRAE